MVCKRKWEGEKCVIDIDGKTLEPIAYMSYAPLKENFDEIKARGVRLFMFPVYAGDEGINMESGLRPLCDNFFKGYGEYDFSMVDKVLFDLCPTGKEDVYVIPRVCLEPPIWWQKLHPDELSLDSRGETQRESFSSKVWLEEMTVALYALIDHLSESRWSERIIGYHIAAGGTEEWAHHSRYNHQFYDYSEVNRRAYHKFLMNRYGSLEAISSAHGISYSSLDAIKIPHPIEREYSASGYIRDPETERHVLDFFDFHNESVADAIAYFCHAVKEYTKGERLTGVFYGYVNSMPQNKKGLHALGKVIRCPDVDFLSTTNSGPYWYFSSAVKSAKLHGKMWICEGDIRTCLTSGMGKNLAHAMPDNDYYESSVWHGPADVKGSVASLTKALARILTSNVGIWWFDMFGGWFSDPDMLNVIERSIPLYREQKHDFFPTEVAIFVDERGHKYSSIDERRMPKAIWELFDNISLSGFSYDSYLLSDICEDSFPADKYRLCIFISACNPSDEEISAIEKKLKKDGKTLLFLGNSGSHSKCMCEFDLRVDPYPKEQKAVFENTVYPANVLPSPTLVQERGYVMSRFEDGTPAVLWQKMSNYHCVLSLPMAAPALLLRRIALLAGVHLFNRDGDAIYAGGEYVGILATETGYRRICLPERDMLATDPITGEKVTVNDRFVDMWMEKGDMRLLHFEKRE